MTGLVLALLAGLVVVGLMVLAARDAFRQTSERWTDLDDLAVRRMLQDR